MELHYREFGQGQPLIIIHGLFGMLDNWLSFAKRLAVDYKVYIPDMRNHGRSFHSEEHTYDAMAKDLHRFYTTHSLDHIVLIGHSMGGKVAMQFAQMYPECMDKLLVVDVAPAASRFRNEAVIKALESLRIHELSSRDEADEALKHHIPSGIIRQWLLKNLYRTGPTSFAWRFNLDVLLASIGNMEKATDKAVFYGPTLFVKGAASDHISASDTAMINRLFPSNELVTIADARHWVHYDQPEMLMQVVEGFLRKNQ